MSYPLADESAINATQVVVKFNKEVVGGVGTEANLKTNYKLAGVSPQTAVLDTTDKKTVLLTFASAAEVELNGAAIVVEPITTVEDATKKTERYAGLFTYEDTKKPTVVETSYVSGKIVVTFSEPLKTEPTVIRVNGNPVDAANYTIGSDDRTVEISGVTLGASSTASLYVAGGVDKSDNVMDLYNGSVTTPAADSVKPFVTSVTQVGQNKVRLVLNESLSAGTDLVTGDVKLLKGTSILEHSATPATGTSLVVTKNTTVDSTGKTYDVEIDLNGTTPAGDGIFASGSTSEAFTVLIDADKFGDAAGNLNNAYSQSITLNADKTAPTFVSSKVADSKKGFELTFSEDVTIDSLAGVIVTDADGVRHSVVSGAGELTGTTAEKLVLDITTGDTVLAVGTYNVYVPAGALKDGLGNKNASAVNATFTVSATTPVDPKPTVTLDNNGNNVFTATFNEEVTTATALNLANYKLDGQSLPSGTQIYFKAGTTPAKSKVEIVLPANSINIGKKTVGTSAILTVSNVQDTAGNSIDTTSKALLVEDNTAATLQSAQLLADTLVLTFSENLDSATAPADITALLADFVIKSGSTTFAAADVDALVDADGDTVADEAATATTSISGNKLTINIVGGESNWSTVKAGALTITTDGALVEDANDIKVKDAVTVTVLK